MIINTYILVEYLGMKKLSKIWVPRALTPNQKRMRVMVCKPVLAFYKEQTESFFDIFVTMDESWAYHCDPKPQTHSSFYTKKEAKNAVTG